MDYLQHKIRRARLELEQERKGNLSAASCMCTALFLVGFFPIKNLPVAPLWWIVGGVLTVLCAVALLDMFEEQYPYNGKLLSPGYYHRLLLLCAAPAALTWLAIVFGLLA